MKTKIKNEFQNPDLVFGNENQKQKSKMKIDFYFLKIYWQTEINVIYWL